MSTCDVYAVHSNGDVLHYKSARNVRAGALLIWLTLQKKYGLDNGFYDFEPLWDAVGCNVMSPQHDILVASTFDNVIISKDMLLETACAWLSFYKEHGANRGTTTKVVGEILIEISQKEDILGAAFRQTSIIECPWTIRIGDDQYKPYNVNTGNKHSTLSDILLSRKESETKT